MHNRLKQFLVAENITQAQFASTIGVGKANISHVLSGRNKPGYDFIRAIMAGYPHLNINWLILGTGKMYTMNQPASPKPVEDGTIIFDTEPLPLIMEDTPVESYNDLPPAESNEETEVLTSIKESTNSTQVVVKQRKVSKVIVLFDDGSFQEM